LDQAQLDERRRLLAEHARRVEEERHVQELRQHLAAWQEATLIRSFLSALKSSAARRGMAVVEDGPLHVWMKWAEGKADQLDPVERLLGQGASGPT
jgi:hypothetical protein